MNEFLRNFVLNIINKMIDSNKEDDYKIMNYALGWYEKNVLVQADLEAVQESINIKNTPVEVEEDMEIIEEPREEFQEGEAS